MRDMDAPPMKRPNRVGSPYIDNDAVDTFGSPGCVVALENVNFRADIDDILAFFEGFDVSTEDVIRRFDENGKPTGDARVSFKSPEDALKSVDVLNNKPMLGRPVRMSVI